MITFAKPIKTPTPENVVDILTNLSESDILAICELFGPCQASITLLHTLRLMQTFQS